MANCTENKNPLQRNGTSQQQRNLPGLENSFVQIDEHRYSDWIAFAASFSKYLHYYNPATDAPTSDWQAFFTKDVSSILGTIAVQPIEVFRTKLNEHLNFIKNNDNAGNEPALKEKLSLALSAIFTLSFALDDYERQLTNETPFKSVLQNLIIAKLGPALKRLVSYYKAAQANGLYQIIPENTNWQIVNRNITDVDILLNSPKQLSEIWGIDVAIIPADDSIFGTSPIIFRQVSHAANHYLFSSVFDQFCGTFSRLIFEAEQSLLLTLENWGSHSPDYTLFLTFLKLFKNSQNQLNSLTWRHLDFYYKEILRLKPKPAIPDKVHLVAELSAMTNSRVLKKGSLFKAGMDSIRKEVVYGLEKETTFNKAEVALFKSIYKGDPSGKDNSINSNRYFAAPIINSADGNGAEIKTTFKSWQPFVNKTYNNSGQVETINMPVAEMGFAVSSHYLFMAEGNRTIRVRLDVSNAAAFLPADFVCYITAEKKWLEITPSAIVASCFSNGESCQEIVINVPNTEPAITTHNLKVHGGSFNTDVPVIKFILKNDIQAPAYKYESLKNISISKVEIKVEAGTTANLNDGLKQLVLSNQNGSIDASKPFQPWGALPEKDNLIVIGSKELFSKKNTSFNLYIEWANRPASISPSPSANLQFLLGGIWKNPEVPVTINPACGTSPQKIADTAISADALIDYKDPYTNYNSVSYAGFMRIVLNGNFGHAAYSDALTLYLIDKAKVPAVSGLSAPGKPHTPNVKSLVLNYASYTGVASLTEQNEDDFTTRPVSVYHIAPFGEAEQHAFLNKESFQYLLPLFQSKNKDNVVVNNVAEFYIGIKNLTKGQAVNILFQLLEGTSDPLTSKPEEHIHWSYLSHNQWKYFDNQAISDATNQFLQSGIISFAMPEDVSSDNTLFPSGYTWIKAGVAGAVDAIAHVLSVHAQAMVAVFLPNGNAADFLDTPLKAGTISKLKYPDVSFKKIEQPYSSFGGRQTEASSHFYLRISERLRHKGRAIIIWDYERLVLEAFPQLYKVKCLNHTRIEDNTDANQVVYNENAPGYVSIITIPNLANRNETNPLRPFTNQNLLVEIKKFLSERISGQVKVNVCNPVFEEIYFDFKLKLKEEFTDFNFYRNLLKEEITEYLSPWAFAGNQEVQFGGKIYKSSLIDFIEERYYVDIISDVLMFHKLENQGISGDMEEIEATTSRSILVSAPADLHEIEPYITEEAQQEYECINLKPVAPN